METGVQKASILSTTGWGSRCSGPIYGPQNHNQARRQHTILTYLFSAARAEKNWTSHLAIIIYNSQMNVFLDVLEAISSDMHFSIAEIIVSSFHCGKFADLKPRALHELYIFLSGCLMVAGSISPPIPILLLLSFIFI